MKEFLSNLGTAYWWLSVVVVGILINLISAYLKPRFDSKFSSASTWWRNKSEAQKAERRKMIAKLRGNHHEQIMVFLEAVFLLLIALLFIFVGGMFGLLVDAVKQNASPTFRTILSAISLVVGVALLIRGMIRMMAAFDKGILIQQVRQEEKIVDAPTDVKT